MYYLCRRKAALGNLKAAFIALVCIFFAASTNESAQEASQEASITTKGGHNRRQAPVIY